jgi:hypothetical protein
MCLEVAHVRCQCLYRECGSVRIGLAVYERLKQYLETSGILYLISFCVNRKFVTSSSPFHLLPYGIPPIGVLPTRTPPVHRDTLWTLTPVLACPLAAPGVHL